MNAAVGENLRERSPLEVTPNPATPRLVDASGACDRDFAGYRDYPPRVHWPNGAQLALSRPLAASRGWYDFSITAPAAPDYHRRIAGRMETGAPSITDPAMHGTAIGDQSRPFPAAA